jgi:FAD/FMN-containing dehydrogenase
MEAIMVANHRGEKASVGMDSFEKLKSSLRHPILQPGDDGYDGARTIWNAMIDRRPALIIRCGGVSDIRRAVEFAGKHGLLTAIRGGGHNIAGNAVCDAGLVIDLSAMRSVRIDPFARKAHVEPGATLAEFDREAQAFGLATPLGINSTTGVAGLTLGGGFGWLTRKYGLTVDNLIGADVVTADNRFMHASETENPDLFWALRGGGGNFGIVTNFEFKLHEVGPNVFSGLVVYPLSEARAALNKYRELASKLSNDANVWVVLRQAPPLPFLPTDIHGKEIIVFALFHAGDPDRAAKELEPVRHFGKMAGEHIGVQPYVNWQAAFDPLLTPGARNYWKSHNFAELSDGAIDTALKYVSQLPSGQCEVFFGLMGGAVSKPPADSTAYAHRDAKFIMNVHARWENKSEDEKCITWARGIFKDMTPFATGGVYVNFMPGDETDRVKAAYGPGFARLTELKKKYDPTNLFSMNQNIRPM